jgi:hypothetical protein
VSDRQAQKRLDSTQVVVIINEEFRSDLNALTVAGMLTEATLDVVACTEDHMEL